MKLIALTLFKNEEWILPTNLSITKNFVDEIVTLDDGSTDNSCEILERFGASVYKSDNPGNNTFVWAEKANRQKLLDLGRAHGGSHFIVLDADEAPTTTLAKNCRKICSELSEGESASIRWLQLWKDYKKYRHDQSPWSNSFFPCICCDDKSKNFIFGNQKDISTMHSGRLHTSQEKIRTIPTTDGAVLHYQWACWNNAQAKQAWYRVSELTIKGWDEYEGINSLYSAGLLWDNVGYAEVPEEWTNGITQPTALNVDESWSEQSITRKDLIPSIIKQFDDNGIEKYEPLQIWHVKPLEKEFIKRTGRRPNGGKI